MDLDYRQTRRLYLAGTVAFSTPYPSSGIISFEAGNLKYAAGEPAKAKAWVVVQEYSHRDRTIIRAILPGRRGGNLHSWDAEVEW